MKAQETTEPDLPLTEKLARGYLLTRKEVADFFGVAPQTVRLWERRDALPSIRLNKRVVRYRAADVERLIEEGVVA